MRFKAFPYYWGAIAVTKSLSALFFSLAAGKRSDRVTLSACTGRVRHMGRFFESRSYTFILDDRLTGGEAEVLLLDRKKQPILRLNRQHPCETVELDGENSRYYLRWEFRKASGQCELRW